VGCELEKTDSELVNGRCPLHPNADLELIDEENYFFKFSKYQQALLDLYKNNADFVKPEERFNEIKSFVERGSQDFSISRLASKMSWGIPVPGDEEQVMYVWFDALVNYISCLNWPEDEAKFKEWWPGLQVCGKDNLRQQTAMWQSMLMSAGLPNSKQVLVFGFIGSNGQKMSKSLGNVVNPLDLVAKYGVDATRYFLLREIKPFTDSDFSFEKLETLYNAELANGIGNLASRVATLLEKNGIETNLTTAQPIPEFTEKMEKYAFDEAIGILIKKAGECDVLLAEKKPWKMEDKEEIKKVLEPIAQDILNIAYLLQPFMPTSAEKIIKQFSETQIKKADGLFPRLAKSE
jgi:methionyl-tRNA synthetase